jgi:hypothetical protein
MSIHRCWLGFADRVSATRSVIYQHHLCTG